MSWKWSDIPVSIVMLTVGADVVRQVAGQCKNKKKQKKDPTIKLLIEILFGFNVILTLILIKGVLKMKEWI